MVNAHLQNSIRLFESSTLKCCAICNLHGCHLFAFTMHPILVLLTPLSPDNGFVLFLGFRMIAASIVGDVSSLVALRLGLLGG